MSPHEIYSESANIMQIILYCCCVAAVVGIGGAVLSQVFGSNDEQ